MGRGRVPATERPRVRGGARWTKPDHEATPSDRATVVTARHSPQGSAMRAALVALLGMAAAGEAATLRAALPNGRNLTLHAAHTSDTPSLPSALTQYSLVFAGDGCSRLRSSSLSMPGGGPFALVARRGNCSFDAKMRVARHAGASALLVADSIDNLYALTNDTTAAASSSVGAGSTWWLLLLVRCRSHTGLRACAKAASVEQSVT